MKCIRKPIIPLEALTVIAWMMQTAIRITMPGMGPRTNEPIRMGISAGSYSRKGAAGMSGRCIVDTSTIESAVSIAITAFLITVFLVSFFTLKTSLPGVPTIEKALPKTTGQNTESQHSLYPDYTVGCGISPHQSSFDESWTLPPVGNFTPPREYIIIIYLFALLSTSKSVKI